MLREVKTRVCQEAKVLKLHWQARRELNIWLWIRCSRSELLVQCVYLSLWVEIGLLDCFEQKLPYLTRVECHSLDSVEEKCMSLVRIQIITQRLKEMFSKNNKKGRTCVYCVAFFCSISLTFRERHPVLLNTPYKNFT